jgi:hypothetical protein
MMQAAEDRMFHDTQVLRNPVPVPFEVFERIIELSGLQDIHPTPTQETTWIMSDHLAR